MKEWTQYNSHRPSGVGLEKILIDFCAPEDGREENLQDRRQMVDMGTRFDEWDSSDEEDLEDDDEDDDEDDEDPEDGEKIDPKLLVWQRVQGKWAA